jgi:hypothetical protein
MVQALTENGKPDLRTDPASLKNDILYSASWAASGFCTVTAEDTYEGAVSFTGFECNCAVSKGENGIIFTHADAASGVEFGSTLTDDNIACDGGLPAEEFYSEALAFTVAAVITTTYTFLMCHFFSVLYCVY